MRIAQEEIFGLVLSIIVAYDTVEEAIEIANDTVYGLGAHVQGTNMATVRAVAGQIQSGQVHFNHPDWDPNAPLALSIVLSLWMISARDDICEVVLLEPGTTANVGTAVDERTVPS